MTISTGGVYSGTLQSIIDAKLNELVKKRDTFEANRARVLNAVNNEPDKIEQLHLLLEGTKQCFRIHSKSDTGEIIKTSTSREDIVQTLLHIQTFMKQARYDRSISEALVEDWKSSLLKALSTQSSRYEYASLYANLVTDWLASEKASTRNMAGEDTLMDESFAEIDNSMKLESRKAWEASVFEPFQTDTDNIKDFLARLFGQGDITRGPLVKALNALKEKVADFETRLRATGQFDDYVVRWVIQGLLSSERLSQEKRTVLKDFLSNSTIIAELADVLNLRIANIDEWGWGNTVTVEQRRRVAGFYSIHLDEDILQAILLQYIGTKWAVFFRRAFSALVDTKEAWKSAKTVVPGADHQRRRYYLGTESRKQSLQAELHRHWRSKYLLTQLPKVEWQVLSSAEGDEEADYTIGQAKPQATRQTIRQPTQQMPQMQMMMQQQQQQQQQQMRHQAQLLQQQQLSRQMPQSSYAAVQTPGNMSARGFGSVQRPSRMPNHTDGYGNRIRVRSGSVSSSADEDHDDQDHSPLNLAGIKQGLVHMLQTEILINKRLHGGLTAFRGQFQSWNSLLPHSTVLAVLEFFGLSQRWLKFFEAFLQAPLGFLEDGELEAPRVRKRGIPGSHPLSDMMGETVLFCLDVLINQQFNGTRLWRVHDDFWCWSPDVKICNEAWSSVKRFSKIFGLTLDEAKSGSCQIQSVSALQPQHDSELPRNPIRWGFLYLNSKSGEFEIDQHMVDKHIVELKRQLDEKSSKGIFSWIQAWNAYAITFFATNFGKPAYCFGADHIKRILSTLERMQESVFNGSNAVRHIKDILANRYGTQDVPEGYMFFPTALGGLDLRNPFVRPLQLTQQLIEADPKKLLDAWEASELETYEQAKRTFEKRIAQDSWPTNGLSNSYYVPEESKRNQFLPFEEYIKYRDVYEYAVIPEQHRLGSIFRRLLKEPPEYRIELSPQIEHALGNLEIPHGVESNTIHREWDSMSSYWLWVCQLYGPRILEKFGGLNIVDPGVLPIGMVSLVKGDRVQWK